MNQHTGLTGKHPLRVDVSEAFAQQLREAAQAEHRTTSNYVRRILLKALGERESAEEERS